MNTIIQTPTNNIEESLDFYSKLDFQIISESDPCLVSDGKVCIEINPDRFARAGVKLYADSWTSEVEELEKQVNVLKVDGGYLLSDPSGTWIYLIEGQGVAVESTGVPASVLGNCAGMSLETTDVQKALNIWQILGFSVTMGTLEQGWIALENKEKIGLSIMKPNACPHLFFNPSLTYFNGKEDNPKIIQKIRNLNIPISEEITAFNDEGIVDNVIIRDPGGFGFFIFND